ncbi:hypothetical protein EXIGLDRAFT_718105 [Exidia glandulosa HHB12029]|uniref:Uncharacterized protein n=1 Tax=Exidia glandulosa HHB12029 TaxID=1314781 RepID=A0A165HYS1_EXIGL|nr:hypothetical protein EXIGLDRAFT_718105 [Exidia glandulosa HHB12029]
MGALLSSESISRDSTPGSPRYCTTYDELLVWHQLARVLQHALPLELVIAILRHAELLVPIPRLSVTSRSHLEVIARTGAVEQRDWFTSPPLTHQDLAHIAAVQLHTQSHDQGWASQRDGGSWTWFDLCLARTGRGGDGLVEVRKRAAGELRWMSHHNPIASRKPDEREGAIFDVEHEIWTHARDGDVILVRVCAQYPGWANIVYAGSLTFWRYFEPSVI